MDELLVTKYKKGFYWICMSILVAISLTAWIFTTSFLFSFIKVVFFGDVD